MDTRKHIMRIEAILRTVGSSSVVSTHSGEKKQLNADENICYSRIYRIYNKNITHSEETNNKILIKYDKTHVYLDHYPKVFDVAITNGFPLYLHPESCSSFTVVSSSSSRSCVSGWPR